MRISPMTTAEIKEKDLLKNYNGERLDRTWKLSGYERGTWVREQITVTQ